MSKDTFHHCESKIGATLIISLTNDPKPLTCFFSNVMRFYQWVTLPFPHIKAKIWGVFLNIETFMNITSQCELHIIKQLEERSNH